MRSKLKSFSLRSLKSREAGIFEVSDRLLGFKMCEFSQKVMSVVTLPSNKRRRALKPYNQIKQLPLNSRDICHDNVYDTYYPARPEPLDNFSLYQFLTWYEVKPTPCKPISHNQCFKLNYVNKYIHKRNDEKILKIYDVRLHNKASSELYFFQQLFLFLPWRQESELIIPYKSYYNAFLAWQNEYPSNNNFSFDKACFNKYESSCQRHINAIKKTQEIEELIKIDELNQKLKQPSNTKESTL